MTRMVQIINSLRNQYPRYPWLIPERICSMVPMPRLLLPLEI
jgi:hypothetical protein